MKTCSKGPIFSPMIVITADFKRVGRNTRDMFDVCLGCRKLILSLNYLTLFCSLSGKYHWASLITLRKDTFVALKSNVLSSTLPEIDPHTAYVVCISVSLCFRHKPSDTALLSVIALTTFNCIVCASVTKNALVCFFVTML